MLYSPPTSDSAGHVDEDDGGHYQSFDASRPFRGLVLCCTSIEADQRVSAVPLKSYSRGALWTDWYPRSRPKSPNALPTWEAPTNTT